MPNPATEQTLDGFYNAFLAEALERFPHLKGRLIIVDGPTRRVYHDVSRKQSLSEKALPRYLRRHKELKDFHGNPERSSFAHKDDDRFWKQKVVALIGVNQPGLSREEPLSEKTRRQLLYVLDHELGHLGLKQGYTTQYYPDLEEDLRAEAVADAYAHLRYYQRFGDSGAPPLYDAARRARGLCLGDKSHFTSFVIEAVDKLRRTADLTTLDAAETAKLAEELALAHKPSAETTEKIAQDFTPVREAFNRSAAAGWATLINMTFSPGTETATAHAAALWLKGYLETSAPVPLSPYERLAFSLRLKARVASLK